MKVILIDGGTVDCPQDVTCLAPGMAAVRLLADSAVVRGNRPVFLPEAGSPWQGSVSVAYRVSRLGKNISGRFAHRYYDAVTLCVLSSPAVGAFPSGLEYCIDGILSLGEWQPLDAAFSAQGVSGGPGLSLECGDGMVKSRAVIPDAGCTGIDTAISAVSRYVSLKMGDVIIPYRFDGRFPLDLDMSVSVSLGDVDVLSYRMK